MPSHTLYQGVAERVRQVAAVYYFGRSGSILFSSLLDGHPQVLTLPPNSAVTLLEELCDKLEGASASTGGAFDMEAFVEWLSASHPDFFRDRQTDAGRYRVGPDHDQAPGTDEATFRAALTAMLRARVSPDAPSPGEAFKLVHLAYAASRGNSLERDDYLIVWQAHVPGGDRRAQARRYLGDCRFITTVRLPERAFDSLVHHHCNERRETTPRPEFIPQGTLSELMQADHLEAGEAALGDAAMVRFEDVHERTRATMAETAAWLDLAWDDILLRSTCDAAPLFFRSRGVWLNGTRALRCSDFSLSTLSWADRILIYCLFESLYRAWGYPPPFRWLAWLPGRLRLPLALTLTRWAPSGMFAMARSIQLSRVAAYQERFRHEAKLLLHRRQEAPPRLAMRLGQS